MTRINPEQSALQTAYETRHRLNEASSWLAVFMVWAIAFCAGGFIEGNQFYIIYEPFYVNDDNEMIGAKFWLFWATIVFSMIITGAFIHFTLSWLLARAPLTEEGIRALMGVLMAITAVMTPFIIYATLSANPTTSDGSDGTYALVLLRTPLVLGAVLLMGIAILGMKLALQMKANQKIAQTTLADTNQVVDICARAWELSHTKPQRMKKMTTELYLEIAEAVNLAAQIRGDYAIERAQGKMSNDFTTDVNIALVRGLAAYHPDVQRLVMSAMPATIPYATLPSTENLNDADREALMQHGMNMKTLSTNNVLNEMKKCA